MEPGIRVDSSLNSFLVKSHPAALNYEGFQMINANNSLSSLTPSLNMLQMNHNNREKIKNQHVCQSIFEIIYKTEDNIYKRDNLIYIDKVESGIEKLAGYNRFCWKKNDLDSVCEKPYRDSGIMNPDIWKKKLNFSSKFCVLSIFIYRAIFNEYEIRIFNGVALFVIIGIGVDDVFIFINTFQSNISISNKAERLLKTLKSAGRTTFFTSFTTSAAFAANMSSPVPAVRDFGLFMSIIVSSCWLVVVLIMPAALNLHDRFNYDKLMESCEKIRCCGTSLFAVPEEFQLTIRSSDNNPPIVDNKKRTSHVNLMLQSFIYRFVAKNTIKYYGICFLIFCAIGAISMCLMVHLKTSSNPMKLFQVQSNEQKLLDIYFKQHFNSQNFSKRNFLTNVTLEKSLVVHLYFGIKTIKRKKMKLNNRVKEKTVFSFDNEFQDKFKFSSLNTSLRLIKELCLICNYVHNHPLVLKNGAQCYFSNSQLNHFVRTLRRDLAQKLYDFDQAMGKINECWKIPPNNSELLLVVILTTLSIISSVIGIFYIVGWRIGRIEAVSLSILFASSVDYCMHIAEAFNSLEQSFTHSILHSHDRKSLTKSAMYSIGSSLFSSAITTMMAAVPLTQAEIYPISKFSKIILINTAIAIITSLTLCPAFISYITKIGGNSIWKRTLSLAISAI
ncbi:DgyrCDS4670, partial [Dimorphilus gyrociliatus]